jgi:hypothetical protein
MPTDFESFGIEQLDDVLSTFYLEMRNKNGEMYKKTTMVLVKGHKLSISYSCQLLV